MTTLRHDAKITATLPVGVEALRSYGKDMTWRTVDTVAPVGSPVRRQAFTAAVTSWPMRVTFTDGTSVNVTSRVRWQVRS